MKKIVVLVVSRQDSLGHGQCLVRGFHDIFVLGVDPSLSVVPVGGLTVVPDLPHVAIAGPRIRSCSAASRLSTAPRRLAAAWTRPVRDRKRDLGDSERVLRRGSRPG